MRKLLNTLYVTMPDAYLARDGETLVVRVDDEVKLRIPIINLEGVVCFGYPGMSPALMRLCVENNVSVSFVNEYGKFLARVTGPVKGNILLRKAHFRACEDDSARARIAATMVGGKLLNCRTVLSRALRDHADKLDAPKLRTACDALMQCHRRLERTTATDAIRGIEGQAAALYFDALDQAIVAQKQDFSMVRRSRRPPMDRFNALLSLLYALLASDVTAALECVGLDPAAGFLHRDRSDRVLYALTVILACLGDTAQPLLAADRDGLHIIRDQHHHRQSLLRPDYRLADRNGGYASKSPRSTRASSIACTCASSPISIFSCKKGWRISSCLPSRRISSWC